MDCSYESLCSSFSNYIEETNKKKRPDRKLNHFLFIVRIDDRMFNGEKNCFTNNGVDRKGLDDDGGEDKVDPCKTKFMKKI